MTMKKLEIIVTWLENLEAQLTGVVTFKNMSDNDFKYLTEKFGSKYLGLLKQKDAYPYEYMDNFKRFSEEKLPD